MSGLGKLNHLGQIAYRIRVSSKNRPRNRQREELVSWLGAGQRRKKVPVGIKAEPEAA